MTSINPVQHNPSQIYRYHVENLREIEIALKNTGRLARETIARRDPENSLRSWLRMYTLLIGTWAECRLQKLLHEEFGFTFAEREQVESNTTKLGQWEKIINLAFRKHYGIAAARLNDQSLGSLNNGRYVALQDTLASDLKVIIEIRNKLAHGQWINPLNSEGTRLNIDKQRLLNEENLMSLQLKLSLIGHLADLVHDLVVSPATFERDFDYHYDLLCQVRINLRRKDYNKYKSRLERRAITRRMRASSS
jgi:hypothetical protein